VTLFLSGRQEASVLSTAADSTLRMHRKIA
jgi:hypothetical protein